MSTLNAMKLARRVTRARSVAGLPITYGLGSGGVCPSSITPANKAGKCDCSGFVAWALGLSRLPKISRPWWIETTNIVRDANGAHKVFVAIERPVAGCVVVYGDSARWEGHCAIVTDAQFDSRGNLMRLRGVDCSSGQSRRTGSAISERDLWFFVTNGATFALLKEDLS